MILSNFVELPIVQLDHRGGELVVERWFNPAMVAAVWADQSAPPSAPAVKKKGAPVKPAAPSRCFIRVDGQVFGIDWPLLDLLAVLADPQDD